jgi:flagellar biosynthesis/type III secretory pathway protein FliH
VKQFIALVTSVVLVMVMAYITYRNQGENNALKLENTLRASENRLLKDQVAEYEFKIQSARTYEEGLTEGLVRSNNRGYTDGYHAATVQAAEEKMMKENKTVTNTP